MRRPAILHRRFWKKQISRSLKSGVHGSEQPTGGERHLSFQQPSDHVGRVRWPIGVEAQVIPNSWRGGRSRDDVVEILARLARQAGRPPVGRRRLIGRREILGIGGVRDRIFSRRYRTIPCRTGQRLAAFEAGIPVWAEFAILGLGVVTRY